MLWLTFILSFYFHVVCFYQLKYQHGPVESRALSKTYSFFFLFAYGVNTGHICCTDINALFFPDTVKLDDNINPEMYVSVTTEFSSYC